MFKNIGEKIKKLVLIVTILEMILVVILAITVALLAKNVILFFIIAIVGVLAAWIGAFFLYGYGELVNSSMKTQSTLETMQKDLDYIKERKYAKYHHAEGAVAKEPVKEAVKQEVKQEVKEQIDIIAPSKPQEKPNLFCPNCGARVHEGKSFCSACGARIEG